jgi:hypothetical protein|eukprot:SAG25_NODE_422_length_8201_cov_86.324940_3_plen_142_part_00
MTLDVLRQNLKAAQRTSNGKRCMSMITREQMQTQCTATGGCRETASTGRESGCFEPQQQGSQRKQLFNPDWAEFLASAFSVERSVHATSFVQRVHGFYRAPVDGTYTFAVASAGESELWFGISEEVRTLSFSSTAHCVWFW